MATRAGQATARTSTATVTNAHNARASTNAATVDPGTAAGDGGDQTFELAAGASIVVHSDFRTNANVSTPIAGDLVMWVELLEDNVAAGEGVGFLRSVQTLSKAGGTLAINTLYAGTDVTFFATSDGTSGGTAKAGTYRIRVRIEYAQVTNDAVNGKYKADSDGNYSLAGTPNTWTAGIAEADKGFLRAGIKFAFTFSDASLGGAEPSGNKFVYPKSQFFQAALQRESDSSACSPLPNTSTSSMTLTQNQGAGNLTTDNSSLSTNNEQWTRTGGIGAGSGINNVFAAADTNTQVKITQANSTLSGIPWTHFTSLPAGWTGATGGGINTQNTQANSPTNLFTIDPRIQFAHLLQLNDSAFGTPPSSKDVASGQRLTADLGFIASQAQDINGSALANGLVWTEKLWDSGNLISSESSPWKSRSSTGSTQGGQTSWSDAFMTWDAQLPGGSWTQKEVITTANATGLETANTRTLTLLAINPNLRLLVGIGPSTEGAETDHLHAGDPFRVEISMFRRDTHAQVVLDSAAAFSIFRYNPTADRFETLQSDFTWVALNGATVNEFVCSAAGGDANTWTYTFTGAQTSGWGAFDLLAVIGIGVVNSTPYQAPGSREILGTAHPHTGYVFDPTGLFK